MRGDVAGATAAHEAILAICQPRGEAWYAGDPRRTGWDAGVGLRLGASRSTDTDALRFDLARRFGNDAQGPGWVVTVGKGFVFSSLTR